MISRVEIENLKALGDRQRVELAPITLIYGPNSAGKSSLLQALAVLKQTLEPRAARIDIERQPLNLRGDLVDLGSFGAAVHGHDLKAQLGFGMEFEQSNPLARTYGRSRQRLPGYVALRFGFDSGTYAVEQHDVTVGVGEHTVRYLPARAPPPQQDIFAATEGFFRPAAKEDGLTLARLARALLPTQDPRSVDLAGGIEQLLAVEERPYFIGRGFFPYMPYMRPFREREERTGAGQLPSTAFLASRLRDLVYSPVSALTELLSSMAYLGPLRAAPTRFQARTGEVYGSVGSRGEHTPSLLLQVPRLIDPVNRWLGRLGIHYTLQVDPVESESIGLEIGDLTVTRLIDARSGIAVTPQDVGFGISQLLPVVVQVLAGRGRTICVEQPEIHIHPRLQAEVADLLIAAAEQHGNQVIVETHSEHLMLRLQRRIREGGGSGWLQPDKVCVIYVDHDSRGVAKPIRLRIAEDGSFIDEWPHGFFAERLTELFSSEAPPRRRTARPVPPSDS